MWSRYLARNPKGPYGYTNVYLIYSWGGVRLSPFKANCTRPGWHTREWTTKPVWTGPRRWGACTYSPAYLKRSERAMCSWTPEIATAATQMPTNISLVRSLVNLRSSGCMMALYLDTDQNIKGYCRNQNVHDTYWKLDINSLLSLIFSMEQALKIDLKVHIKVIDKVVTLCPSYTKDVPSMRLINKFLQPILLNNRRFLHSGKWAV